MKRRDALVGFLNPIAVALVVAGLIGVQSIPSQLALVRAGASVFAVIWLLLED